MNPEKKTIHLNDESSSNRTHSLFRTVWRWHLYAGLLFAPILIILSISGGIYLFKPQIESWLYQDLLVVSEGSKPLSAADQIAKVTDRYPEAVVTSFTPPVEANRSSAVGMIHEGQMATAYVNPYSGEVLGKINEDERFMAQVKSWHNGELWGGTFGNRLVELAACWALILILTGMYLWWPRNRRSWWGTALPRLRKGSRIFWRDLHAVPAFWLSTFVLVLIFTGLPWSGVWGDMVNKAATATNTGYPTFAFSWGPKPESTQPVTKDVADGVPWAAENMPVPVSEDAGAAQALSVDEVMKIAVSQGVRSGYTVSLPDGEKGVYTVSTKPQRPQDQVTMHLDQYSGEVLVDRRFHDYGPVAKAISIGIALHEGRYFGWVNQWIGAVVCLGFVGFIVSGVILWWRRKPRGKLGAPSNNGCSKAEKTALGILVGMGLIFPLVGISLLAVFLLDWLVVQRIPAVKKWLSGI